MTTDTQLGMASGSKTFTALVVMRLVEEGLLSLSTTAREVLGTDLPLIADDVTVEHLLSHRSGIGDYLDEDELDSEDYPMPVSVHRLVTTEDFLPILDGYPTKFPAGERFSYCNGGFVVLALIAERVAGRSYHDLVRELVCSPAGMAHTDFLRSDALPGTGGTGLRRGRGPVADQRLPPAGGRHRRRRDVHDHRRHGAVLDGPDVRADRPRRRSPTCAGRAASPTRASPAATVSASG